MDEKILEIASDAIGVDVEAVKANSKHLPELDAWYCWDPKRGGRSVIVNTQYEKLSVGSAINFARLLEAFKEGERN